MMPQGVQAPYGIIDRMGCPGKRVPVGRVKVKKSPLKKIRAQGADMDVFQDVDVVVPVHESILQAGNIDQERND
jgi:hypothetical protein